MTYYRLIRLFILFIFVFTCNSYAIAESSVNKIIAVVNGDIITKHELDVYSSTELARQNISPDDPRAEIIRRNSLDMMINDILIRHDSEKYRINIGSSEIESEYKRFVQGNNLTPDQFAKRLAAQGLTVDQFKQKLKDSLLRQRMINFMIAKKIIVDEKEMEKFYEENKKDLIASSTVDFSVIIFKPSDKVDQIANDLRSGKISFADAAKKYSIEASGPQGGRVGVRTIKQLPPFIQTTIKGMKDGELSKVFNVDKTKGILFVHSIDADDELTFDKAKPKIERILREGKVKQRFDEYTNSLKSKAVIDIRLK